jgi:hypothetical protein
MEKRRYTIKNLENSIVKYVTNITGKIRRKSFTAIDDEDDKKEPFPPVMSKRTQTQEFEHPRRSIFQRDKTDDPSEKFYNFFCTNGSSNLSSILVPYDLSKNFAEMPDVEVFDHSVFDINDRIIPEYYINKTGITVGALNFDFYNSIIDSIRNMRILSEYQITFIEICTREEYLEIIKEYNNVIRMLNEK